MMTVRCGKCGSSYHVTDANAGRSGKCKKCGAPIVVPAAEPDRVEDLAAAPLPRTRYVPPEPPSAAKPAEPKPFRLPWYFGFCRLCSGLMIVAGLLGIVGALARAASIDGDKLTAADFAPAATGLGMIFSGGFALAVLDGMAAMIRRGPSETH